MRPIITCHKLLPAVCRDMEESYLPAFQACVQDGGAASVMCSYNAVNGTPSCANQDLLQKVHPPAHSSSPPCATCVRMQAHLSDRLLHPLPPAIWENGSRAGGLRAEEELRA